ncbi:MAG: DegT/DnrJ/EryC1/StrS family aminotransferase [Actinobacteria bacterium]|nr:DegT/DnrJ/EryC1/StrS family aminotransferase [Actinomycetota bacterium]
MEIKTITKGDIFEKIPSKVMNEMEDAVLTVLREWKMSKLDLTKEFERKFADWHGLKYGLGYNNGTAAILGAMYGIGIGPGDEIICSSITYWASCLPAYTLGATVVFADIEPDTLCIDPNDIESKITDKTKAIIVVHYSGMPAKMDEIMKIANKHNFKVIEDASHTHGALYKGKMVGTFGEVSAFSLMSAKSFGIGEAGILLTDDREIYERAIIFGHYLRHDEVHIEYLKKGIGLPWGGCKQRMHQMSAAIGLVLLKYYPEMMQEIDKAMNYFWDLLEDCPGIRAHRPDKNSGSTKGGWYNPLGLYRSEELGGLSITRFCEALQVEDVPSLPGCNKALHLHPIFNTIDIYNEGKPTIISRAKRDVRKLRGKLPVSEGIQEKVFTIPLFYKYEKKVIEKYAYAFKKVINNYKELLPGDKGNLEELGGWSGSFRR